MPNKSTSHSGEVLLPNCRLPHLHGHLVQFNKQGSLRTGVGQSEDQCGAAQGLVWGSLKISVEQLLSLTEQCIL